jgi:hypothetical protein
MYIINYGFLLERTLMLFIYFDSMKELGLLRLYNIKILHNNIKFNDSELTTKWTN